MKVEDRSKKKRSEEKGLKGTIKKIKKERREEEGWKKRVRRK